MKRKPPQWRKTPLGQEREITYLLQALLEKQLGYQFGDDGTGMVWSVCDANMRRVALGESLSHVVYDATAHAIRSTLPTPAARAGEENQ